MRLSTLEILPQRPPFLLIDVIVDHEVDRRIVAIKNLSHNDPFFAGNIPQYPVMPGSLVVEAFSQTASALMYLRKDLSGRLSSFRQAKKFTLKRDILPGDQLRLEVDVLASNREEISFKGLALVDGNIVAEIEFSFAFTQLPSKSKIHPTATIHPSAMLGKDVVIGAYSIVGENVFIGDGTVVEAHVMIDRWTRIGEENHIHFGAVIGSAAQDAKYSGEESWVVIGDGNEIREYVTINRATGKDAVTQIGSKCMFLTNVHIGHNCKIGDGVTMANMVHVGGHAVIDDRAIIGGLTGIHQFVRVGRGSMTGGYSRLIQDVPPFMLCDGNPAYVRGVNAVGLKRGGITGQLFKDVKAAYKLLYRSNTPLKLAIEELEKLAPSEPLAYLLAFLKEDTTRGISRKIETVEDDQGE